MNDELIDQARAVIEDSEALLITSGAGMGVDSGLPDFRGNEGFWRAYPPFKDLGLSFSSLANPRWFSKDPRLAWGFYGHRLALYRKTVPHTGFGVLARWAKRMRQGAFVFTSNVDGAFQRAGFDKERIVECHGAIDFVQCMQSCDIGILSADAIAVEIDAETFRATGALPSCPRCSGMLRPNILLFGDSGFDGARVEAQEARMESWLANVRASGAKLTIVECGAGTAIPTVRMLGERIVSRFDAKLVRINVREPEVPQGQIGIAEGARATLEAIDALFAP